MPKRARSPKAGATTKASKSSRIRALLATGKSAADIAKEVGCSTNLVYVVKSSQSSGGGRGRTRRGPGRPAGSGAHLGGLDGILAAVKTSERDRATMRAALEKIQQVIAQALA